MSPVTDAEETVVTDLCKSIGQPTNAKQWLQRSFNRRQAAPTLGGQVVADHARLDERQLR